MKCNHCKKKINLITVFYCKCSNVKFCFKCRFNHNCIIDYIGENKKIIESKNPKIEFKKLDKI